MKSMPKKKIVRKEYPEEKWERGELGASEEFVRRVSRKKEKEIDDTLGLQVISIRLQKDLIHALKILARRAGIGYQPYIRQLLTHHVRGEADKEKKSGTYG